MLGKDIFVPLFGREYSKLNLADAQEHMDGLDIEIVGGLARRGWTTHDIDVVGSRRDVQLLAERLRKHNIPNPVHYFGNRIKHSHLLGIWNGIKLVLTGKGY